MKSYCYYNMDEFLEIYNRELEKKEKQLWECLSLKYDPRSLVRKQTDTEACKEERERCLNELNEVKNRRSTVLFVYVQEQLNSYELVGDELKMKTSPRTERVIKKIMSVSEIEQGYRNGFATLDGISPILYIERFMWNPN